MHGEKKYPSIKTRSLLRSSNADNTNKQLIHTQTITRSTVFIHLYKFLPSRACSVGNFVHICEVSRCFTLLITVRERNTF